MIKNTCYALVHGKDTMIVSLALGRPTNEIACLLCDQCVNALNLHYSLSLKEILSYYSWCPTRSRNNKMGSASLPCSLLHLVGLWKFGRLQFPEWADSSQVQRRGKRSNNVEATLCVCFLSSRQDTLRLWWLRNVRTNSEKTIVTVNLNPEDRNTQSHGNLTTTVVCSLITSHWEPRQRFPTSAWARCSHFTRSLLYSYT